MSIQSTNTALEDVAYYSLYKMPVDYFIAFMRAIPHVMVLHNKDVEEGQHPSEFGLREATQAYIRLVDAAQNSKYRYKLPALNICWEENYYENCKVPGFDYSMESVPTDVLLVVRSTIINTDENGSQLPLSHPDYARIKEETNSDKRCLAELVHVAHAHWLVELDVELLEFTCLSGPRFFGWNYDTSYPPVELLDV